MTEHILNLIHAMLLAVKQHEESPTNTAKLDRVIALIEKELFESDEE